MDQGETYTEMKLKNSRAFMKLNFILMEDIMRKLMVLLMIIVISGCSSKIAVRTLESTIRDAALAAQYAANGASPTLTIEVQTTQGFKAGATLPIPVVPIQASTSLTTATKLKLNINLSTYTPPSARNSAYFLPAGSTKESFLLDTETGILEEH